MRIDYLGGDTPAESIAEAVRTIEPALLVLAAVRELLWPLDPQIEEVARRHRVASAGAGAQGLDPGPECSCSPTTRSPRPSG